MYHLYYIQQGFLLFLKNKLSLLKKIKIEKLAKYSFAVYLMHYYIMDLIVNILTIDEYFTSSTTMC